jgi:hypothetical protein
MEPIDHTSFRDLTLRPPQLTATTTIILINLARYIQFIKTHWGQHLSLIVAGDLGHPSFETAPALTKGHTSLYLKALSDYGDQIDARVGEL